MQECKISPTAIVKCAAFLALFPTYEKDTATEPYLEHFQIYVMQLFCEKSSIIDVWDGFKSTYITYIDSIWYYNTYDTTEF